MGSLVQTASIVGAATNTRTETFSAAGAGNVLILSASTNENTGTDSINTPAGWTALGEKRQGTTTCRTAFFGLDTSGGETSVTVTSSASQRFQTAIAEFEGYTLTLDQAISSNGVASGVLTMDTGSLTPTVAGCLWLGAVCEKNGVNQTQSSAYSTISVNNESPGTQSTQKVNVFWMYDLAASGAEQGNTSLASPTVGYAGLGILLRPVVVPQRSQITSVRRTWAGA